MTGPETSYCPLCGSTRIHKQGLRYICLDCSSIFAVPKKTKIPIKKGKPGYVG